MLHREALHTETVAEGNSYTRKLLHTESLKQFEQTGELLHTEAGTAKKLFTGAVPNEAASEMGYPAWPAGRTCICYSDWLS